MVTHSTKELVCGLADCKQECLTRRASDQCVALGGLLVTIFTSVRYFQTAQNFSWQQAGVLTAALVVAITAAAITVSVFLSRFERFDNWYMAVLFGASTPALLWAIASISVPS